MAWDASRPVPWKRLVTPFLIYAAVATVAFSFFSKASLGGLVAGVVLGGAIYLGIAAILVKFGWNPPSFGRSAAGRDRTASGTAGAKAVKPASNEPRPKPSPTKRTNAGNRRAPRRR